MALGVIIKGTGGFLLNPVGDPLILWVNSSCMPGVGNRDTVFMTKGLSKD